MECAPPQDLRPRWPAGSRAQFTASRAPSHNSCPFSSNVTHFSRKTPMTSGPVEGAAGHTAVPDPVSQ